MLWGLFCFGDQSGVYLAMLSTTFVCLLSDFLFFLKTRNICSLDISIRGSDRRPQ